MDIDLTFIIFNMLFVDSLWKLYISEKYIKKIVNVCVDIKEKGNGGL